VNRPEPFIVGFDSRAEAGPKRYRLLYLLVAAVALAVYVPGSWWGVPHATAPDRIRPWATDDETPLGPLAEMNNIREQRDDQNLGYPLMYSFVVTAAYSPYLGYLYATGRFAEPTPEYPYGLVDPAAALRTLGIIAHLVTALLATALVVAVFDAGRVAAGRRAGLLYAALAMLAFPMLYYGRTGNVDVPMIAFGALAFAAFTRCVIRGTTVRRAAAFGAAAGFALATKEAILGVFLIMPFVLLYVRHRELRDTGGLMTWAAWKPLLVGLLVSVIALGAGSGLFVDPERYFSHLSFISGRLDTLAETADVAGITTYPYTMAGHIAFARRLLFDLAAILTWPGLALATIGTAWCLARRRDVALLILPGIVYVLYMFLTLRAAQLRYMLPAAVFLALPIAVLARDAWASGRASLRAAALIAVGAVVSLHSLRAIDLTAQMILDSRYAAGDWLGSRLRPGDTVEYFGPTQKLPALPYEVESVRAAPYFGMYVAADHSDRAIRDILAGWDERRPRFVLIIPDHTSQPGAEDGHTLPPEILDSLASGSRWREAAYFRTPRVFRWLPMPRLDYPTVNPPIRIFERRPETEPADSIGN
jgi:hypothetical protein